jgi:CheY-like chemotaxis protein
MENGILIIDDEDYHRELMRKLLTKLAYQVAVVESAEAALALLEKEAFPVILSDLIMLDMDGVEFCQTVRETDSDTVIIALTGHGDLYDSEKLEMVGFDGYLAKPIRMDKIKKALDDALEEAKRRKEASSKD